MDVIADAETPEKVLIADVTVANDFADMRADQTCAPPEAKRCRSCSADKVLFPSVGTNEATPDYQNSSQDEPNETCRMSCLLPINERGLEAVRWLDCEAETQPHPNDPVWTICTTCGYQQSICKRIIEVS